MNTTVHPSDIPRTRRWRGEYLPPAEEMLMFHQDSGPVPETLRRLRAALEAEHIEYVIIGAFALGAHHYRRATEDVDLCLRAADLERFRRVLVGSVYQGVEGRARRFYDPQTQVTFDLRVAGESAGRRDRNKMVCFPDPAEGVDVDGLRTVALPCLLELKLVTGRLEDMADAIELIRRNDLCEDFADKLHPLVRMAYLECYDHRVEEDQYDRELD